MQHDTSPHEVIVEGRKYKAQTAAAVLCYSRMLYFEIWPQFQRFDCKAFLTEALRYLGGAPQRTMIDNTHVVVLRGSGKQMEPVPEMAAFAERMGFRFVAHEIGDANRSARVSGRSTSSNTTFSPADTFVSWQDLNNQARQWCDRVNATYKKHIRVPRDSAIERLSETAARLDSGSLPLHQRIVDSEGYVALHSIATRFPQHSLAAAWSARNAREDRYRTRRPPHRYATRFSTDQRVTLSEHRPPRGEGLKRGNPIQNKRSSTPRREIAPCGGPEAQEPQGDRTRVAATAAYAARVSSRAVSGRDRRGRAVWTL